MQRGQTIANIGRTGSGKQTLMNSLMPYDYTDGSIKIDGVELKHIDKSGYAVILSCVNYFILETIKQTLRLLKKWLMKRSCRSVSIGPSCH